MCKIMKYFVPEKVESNFFRICLWPQWLQYRSVTGLPQFLQNFMSIYFFVVSDVQHLMNSTTKQIEMTGLILSKSQESKEYQ